MVVLTATTQTIGDRISGPPLRDESQMRGPMEDFTLDSEDAGTTVHRYARVS